jgi:hypothetical protein
MLAKNTYIEQLMLIKNNAKPKNYANPIRNYRNTFIKKRLTPVTCNHNQENLYRIQVILKLILM